MSHYGQQTEEIEFSIDQQKNKNLFTYAWAHSDTTCTSAKAAQTLQSSYVDVYFVSGPASMYTQRQIITVIGQWRQY